MNTDWMQDHIDAGVNRGERLDKEIEAMRGDLEAEAIEKHIQEIEDDLYNDLPPGVLTRLCIIAAFPNYRDFLDKNYPTSQGAIDGANFRIQFAAALDSVTDRLATEWKEQQ